MSAYQLPGTPQTRRMFLGQAATGVGAAALAHAFYGLSLIHI